MIAFGGGAALRSLLFELTGLLSVVLAYHSLLLQLVDGHRQRRFENVFTEQFLELFKAHHVWILEPIHPDLLLHQLDCILPIFNDMLLGHKVIDLFQG